VNYGDSTDKLVPGDYNADSKADFAVLRPIGTGVQWIVDTNRDGSADIRRDYGKTSDLPLSADFNGDAAADFAVGRDVP